MGALERVGLLAALPQECSGVLSWPGWRRERSKRGLRLYELKTQKLELRLAVGGMGEKKALAALEALLEGFEAARVICMGFAGALEPGLAVAEVAWINRVLKLTETGSLLEGPFLERPCLASALIPATVVSLPGFLSKKELKETLRGQKPPLLLDLESYVVAKEAVKRGLEFWGIRAVSDEALLDVGPRVAKWVDKDYRIKPSKATAVILQTPSDLALMLRLFIRARKASRSLGRELRRLLLQS